MCPLLCAHFKLELAVFQAEHLVRVQRQDVTQPPHVLHARWRGFCLKLEKSYNYTSHHLNCSPVLLCVRLTSSRVGTQNKLGGS